MVQGRKGARGVTLVTKKIYVSGGHDDELARGHRGHESRKPHRQIKA